MVDLVQGVSATARVGLFIARYNAYRFDSRKEDDRSLRRCLMEQLNSAKNHLSVIEDEYIKDLKDWNGDVALFADCTTNLVKIILQSTAKSRSEAD